MAASLPNTRSDLPATGLGDSSREGDSRRSLRTRAKPSTPRDRSMARRSRDLSAARGIRSRVRSGWRTWISARRMRSMASSRRSRRSSLTTRTRSATSSASAAVVVTMGRASRRTQPDAVERGIPCRVARPTSPVSWTSRTRRWS